MQYLYILIGWDGDEYRVCLLETSEYRLTPDSGASENLTSEISVLGNSGCVTITCTLVGQYTGDWEASFTATWKDRIFWNEESFSFYDQGEEDRVCRVTRNPIRQRIAEARLAFLRDRPPVDGLDDYLNRTPAFFGILADTINSRAECNRWRVGGDHQHSPAGDVLKAAPDK